MEVTELDNVWIEMDDGCRLAARIWLPADADEHPVPAILEANPYRKDDFTRQRDQGRHPQYAERGYASVRLDSRGSGSSEGVMHDEYSDREQEDVVQVLRWLGEQPWCTGRVGMIGISWGGFLGLQVAARRPPELAAVISVCASGNRYGGDVKYHGGCLLGTELLPWASTMLVMNARPPDPDIVGERWRELWLQRLREPAPWSEPWVEHQRFDDYWRRGSPCADYSRIRCPVYAVGGWADPYRDAVFQLLERLDVPTRGLIGPWGHQYPDDGMPGPGIDFVHESLRWWNRWLKDEPNGIEDEPALRFWIQDPLRVEGQAQPRQGRWASEDGWPSPRVKARMLRAEIDGPLTYRGTDAAGLEAGPFVPWGDPQDYPPDQRREDGLSLTFTWPSLDERLEVVGQPRVLLDVEADQPRALVAARVCDVWPDGSSVLVTRGILNLSHRDGSDEPQPLERGRRYRVEVWLQSCGYAFDEGHEIRLGLSPSYWPWAWPSPEPVTLRVHKATLELPVRAVREEPPVPFTEYVAEPGSGGNSSRTVSHHVGEGKYEIVVERSRGEPHAPAPDAPTIGDSQTDVYRAAESDPLAAEVESRRCMELSRDGWSCRVETTSRLWCDGENLRLANEVRAFEGDELVFSDERSAAYPRDLV